MPRTLIRSNKVYVICLRPQLSIFLFCQQVYIAYTEAALISLEEEMNDIKLTLILSLKVRDEF